VGKWSTRLDLISRYNPHEVSNGIYECPDPEGSGLLVVIAVAHAQHGGVFGNTGSLTAKPGQPPRSQPGFVLEAFDSHGARVSGRRVNQIHLHLVHAPTMYDDIGERGLEFL
jgi:hypothetical protein